MEARIGSEAHHFYGMVGSAEMQAMGKRRLEWNPSDWNWDGDLFIASPLAADPSPYHSRQFFPLQTGVATARASSNSSSSCSDEVDLGIQNGRKESEKRRRVVVVDADNLDEEAGTLTLKLGGHSMAERYVENWDGASGKKTKLSNNTSNRAVCQVDDCGADLSKAKDYHRRHKVCEMHSKASRALVGNAMQRFCQQCSRFHALQEFDEGKRSCRRRLAGHNKRRRKTQPDAAANSSASNDNQASTYLLISLLKILSNMHSRTNYTDDQDLLSHLLRSLSNNDGLSGDKCISDLLQESQNFLSNRPLNENLETASILPSNGSQGQSRSKQQSYAVQSSDMLQKKLHTNHEQDEDVHIVSSQRPGIMFPIQDCPSVYAQVRESSAGRNKLNNFDLNDVYVDSDDCIEDADRSPIPVDLGNVSLDCPSWVQQDSHQSSPPQTSGNSDSGSAQSPSSSSGEAQCRTDRIVLKLFGKEPSHFPFVLRTQILDWLSHSPTDIEGYIRPGCIVLTIYLRMPEFAWDEICCDLSSSLRRLVDVSDNESFWRTGWVFIKVQNQVAFMYNGDVIVDSSIPSRSNHYSTILSIKPIAVSTSERAQFTVKGFNIARPSSRLLCALEGNYLAHEANDECTDNYMEHNGFEYVNFSCSIPALGGRGLIEVEDYGLGSSSFPFLVAEKDVCSEICMLEREMELADVDDVHGGISKMDARNMAVDFVHEMGWLLHRIHLKSRLNHLDPNVDLFSFKRFKWLIEFSMEHEWCAVVKKLLNIFFTGIVGAGDNSSLRLALLDVGLLHKAVRKNSRPLVEFLLKYAPEKVVDELKSDFVSECNGSFLFRPDAAGPAGLTPLHVAAGRDGSDSILDALTDDPEKVGVQAWKSARDSTGFTPEDYARLRGHYTYIHLVQKKVGTKPINEHVVLDIPSSSLEYDLKQKESEAASSFQIARVQRPCRLCDQKLVYGNGSGSLLYRPAMLSMVAIAAVCVCVALLFKSSPEVLYVFHPFRWETLDFGAI